jgi:GT2 family glycosyltransferase
MALRRAALSRAGQFDETLSDRGDEEEWERRYTQAGGRIRYVAAAALDHRRTPQDSRLGRLSRAAYHLGRTAWRNDRRKGIAPPTRAEVRTLAGCLWHTLRRRCAIGIVLAAHTAGRLRESLTRGPG